MKITLHPFIAVWLNILRMFLFCLIAGAVLFGLLFLSFKLGEAYAIGYCVILVSLYLAWARYDSEYR